MTSGRNERAVELESLARRCTLTAEFLAARDLIELENWRATIAGAVSFGRVAPMRILAKELAGMANMMLTAQDRSALARELQRSLSVDVLSEEQEADSNIRAVIGRGRIATESEYRLLRARVDEFEGDASRAAELESLYTLLQRYEVGQ